MTAFFAVGDGSMASWTEEFLVCSRQTAIQLMHTLPCSGVQQFLPADYEQKVADFHALLRSMMSGRNYKRVIAGDETGVRMEGTAAPN